MPEVCVARCRSVIFSFGWCGLTTRNGRYRVDVLVEGELPLLDRAHHRHAREGLGDGADVHDRVRGERPRALPVGEAIALHPHDLPVDDHGGAEAHDARLGHLLRDETVEGRIRRERR